MSITVTWEAWKRLLTNTMEKRIEEEIWFSMQLLLTKEKALGDTTQIIIPKEIKITDFSKL